MPRQLQKLNAAIVAFILLSSQLTVAADKCCPCGEGTSLVAGAAVGAAVFFLAPWALPFVGFTGSGIGAGTLAAKAMSLSWTTGVGTGVVSTLQGAATAGGVYKAAKVAGATAYGATKNGCCSCN